MNKVVLSIIVLLLTLMATSVTAAPEPQNNGVAYKVKKGEWLRKVAKDQLGDSKAFQQIIDATNAKAKQDRRFITIEGVASLVVGQLLWIPMPGDDSNKNPVATVTPMPITTATPTPSKAKKQIAKTEPGYVVMPTTDCEIQVWYNYQIVAIPAINRRWKEAGLTLAQRSERAHALRQNARANARYMMADQKKAEALREQDMQKFGNPDGPTFSYQVGKILDSGVLGDAVYQAVLDRAARITEAFNLPCQ
ncbi:MAG: hypothetical protein ACI8WB_001556 [Phenylobacterium sp.]|jgi:hypothetical protein